MSKQTQYQGVERRKKPRAPLEAAPPPAKPQSGTRTLVMVGAVILAIAGLAGLLTIFWMGASGQL